eukprot:2058899-Rhodomonas_salina.2
MATELRHRDGGRSSFANHARNRSGDDTTAPGSHPSSGNIYRTQLLTKTRTDRITSWSQADRITSWSQAVMKRARRMNRVQ